MNTIGDRIKELRIAMEMNQTEFGKKINKKQTTIAGYENNTKTVLERTVKDICRECRASYAWLMFGDGEMFSNNDAALKDKVDRIMESENDFHKQLLESIIDLDDVTLLMLKALVDKLANKKAD